MKIFLCFFPVFILGTSFSFNNANDWVLQKNEQGIEVYTRSVEGSEYKEVRVINSVKSSLSGVVALLLDTKNYPKWIYACGESYLLKQVSNCEFYNYQVTDLPWPMTDRDVVADFKLKQDSTTLVVTFSKSAEPDFIPTKQGFVRIQHLESLYTLTPITSDSVKIELDMYLDPAGRLPAWLINTNTIMGPYKTTIGMIRELANYQSASYYFIREKS